MPTQANFGLPKFSDGNLTVNMAPNVDVGGWSLEVVLARRFGSVSGLLIGGIASGIPNGASGLTVINSGEGIFQIAIPSLATSGLQFGNYAYSVNRVESGFRTVLNQGYLTIDPSIY